MVRRGAIKPMRGRPVQALDAEGGFIEEDRADKLDRVTDLALDHYEAVLRDKVPKRSARYLELVRAKNDAAGNILRTTVRVDQNKLRKGTHDRLGSLLQKIERVEKGLPAVIEGEAKEA